MTLKQLATTGMPVCLATCVAFAQPKHAPLTINIKGLDGGSVATATFTDAEAGGVRLDLNITTMPPGKHVFHIHQKPVCDAAEEFNTAGLQFDPTGEMYGNAEHHARTGSAAGDPHSGIDVTPEGKGHATFTFPKLTMGEDERSIVAGTGRAIVFHAAPGADGPTRIACGVIRR